MLLRNGLTLLLSPKLALLFHKVLFKIFQNGEDAQNPWPEVIVVLIPCREVGVRGIGLNSGVGQHEATGFRPYRLGAGRKH